MKVQQLSVMLPNKAGALDAISEILAQNNINMRAMVIADTKDFGILRLIVDDIDHVAALLKKEGYVYTVTDVIAVAFGDKSGALAEKVSLLAKAGIGIEYAYAFTSSVPNAAYGVFRVDDAEKAEQVLGDTTFKL